LTGATEAAQDISFLAMEEKQDTIVKTVMADPAGKRSAHFRRRQRLGATAGGCSSV
jgi:hypothetical protein